MLSSFLMVLLPFHPLTGGFLSLDLLTKSVGRCMAELHFFVALTYLPSLAVQSLPFQKLQPVANQVRS